ncbi:putative rudimentary enhancer [Toxoplasma gondii TgCatPRC2]|uniref:Enhancer of rudimentary homolog n=15 Tax=Toxoplasma gondii TaxID=5811 RepID=B9Q1Z6_TOXGV|nr:rudimentary enhancer, putative [Toxoplasma gondii ME49]EPR61318.1 putative rudimentary enhancer [Toxoplasma gondii GT1]ESS33368.1 putative rudimentary enhancer [Toxoplasma gondii VEG]KAF4642540.1 putative rudimentary enhancer [Toxoplasma gondii]KFG32366.1 putative rudimentary enhancer [Toxoplasma gondii GAB2-2007-GAL-DOM2]KFG36370.1 putative rudimentary enhancer [Toxoplasma gondii FOU]KFG57379.1 putative rudimentary enhancer [Toxoplasma gondii RUB]KFH00172.1 putative rudimentary enhancer |eukprot:XP_008885929.1 rudimentary enhancer, putative [Hammondia hammondi]
MSHTILLVQFSDRKDSRTYVDYESVPLALDGVCQLYEQALKATNPQLKNITYDVNDLFSYIDSLRDMCALVQDRQSNCYVPHDKQWIKDQAFKHLKKQAHV